MRDSAEDGRNQVWNLPRPMPVSQAVLRYQPRYRNRVHLTGRYSVAFEDFPLEAVRVLGMGGDSLVIELTDGNVLSITNRTGPPGHFGELAFDLPILEQGTRSAGSDTFFYFIRPKARSPVTWDEFLAFVESLPAGAVMVDRKLSNVGEYDGILYLIDPWAVRIFEIR